MTELDAATLRVIADSAESAAKLVLLGDSDGARSALTRAEHRLREFTRDKPWHARVVRLAREAVARARLAVERIPGLRAQGGRREAALLERATGRAIRRAKAP